MTRSRETRIAAAVIGVALAAVFAPALVAAPSMAASIYSYDPTVIVTQGYEIHVVLYTTTPLEHFSMTYTTPANTVFMGTIPVDGVTCNGPAYGSPGTVTCTAASSPTLGTRFVRIQVLTNVFGDVKHDLSATYDGAPSPMTASATTTVGPGPLSFWTVGGATNFKAGISEALFVTLINRKMVPASSVVEIMLPPTALLLHSLTPGVDCSMQGPSVMCSFPAIPPNTQFEAEVGIRSPIVPGTARYDFYLRPDGGPRTEHMWLDTAVLPRDTRLTVDVDPASTHVERGGDVTLTLHAKNSGVDESTVASITAAIPPALTVTHVTTSFGTCAAAPEVNCSGFEFQPAGYPGSSVDVTIVARAADSSTVAPVTATVASATSTSIANATIEIGDGLATTATTLAPPASSVYTDGAARYGLHLLNAGPSDAKNAAVHIAVTSGGAIRMLSKSRFDDCTVGSDSLTCTAAFLAANAGADATFEVTAPSSPGTIHVAATTSVSNGPGQAVTADTAVIEVPAPRDIAVAVPEKMRSAVMGDPTILHFLVTNPGTTSVAHATFDANPDAGLSLVSLATTQGTCAGTHCALGVLNGGDTATITATVTARTTGTQKFSVAVACDSEESLENNNHGAVAITVTPPRSRAARH